MRENNSVRTTKTTKSNHQRRSGKDVEEMGETECNREMQWFYETYKSPCSNTQKDGKSIRPAIDFRKINAESINQIYPKASIQEALANLAGN